MTRQPIAMVALALFLAGSSSLAADDRASAPQSHVYRRVGGRDP